MLIIGFILIILALFGLTLVIDPAEMDRRHNAYAAGWRHGYRGLPIGLITSPYPVAFRAGWHDGSARRIADTIGR